MSLYVPRDKLEKEARIIATELDRSIPRLRKELGSALDIGQNEMSYVKG